MKYIKEFNEGFFNRAKKKVSHIVQSNVLPSFTSEECEENGYRIGFDLEKDQYAFSRDDIKLGDEVFYLGHDGVGGWWYGDKTIADQELVDKAKNLQFYKKVGVVKDFKPFNENVSEQYYETITEEQYEQAELYIKRLGNEPLDKREMMTLRYHFNARFDNQSIKTKGKISNVCYKRQYDEIIFVNKNKVEKLKEVNIENISIFKSYDDWYYVLITWISSTGGVKSRKPYGSGYLYLKVDGQDGLERFCVDLPEICFKSPITSFSDDQRPRRYRDGARPLLAPGELGW